MATVYSCEAALAHYRLVSRDTTGATAWRAAPPVGFVAFAHDDESVLDHYSTMLGDALI